MSINTIKELAETHDVRVSTHKRHGKRIIGLHGFKSNIQALTNKASTHYWIEWTDTGAYLYSKRSKWG